MKSLFTPLLAVCLLSACSAAEAPSPTEFRHRVRALVQAGPAPGLSVAVVRRGELVFAEGFGWTDPWRRTPMTADTVHMWYSATKLVTATAAMRLAEQGRLELDRPVVEFLPHHLLRGENVERLTARNLLSHTSGIANPIPLRWIRLESEAPEPREVLYRRVMEEYGRLRSAPGRRVAYSNLNYLVLAQLIEQASGQAYETYVREEVLEPLGMERSGFAYAAAWEPDVAVPSQREWTPYTLAALWLVDDKILAGHAGGYRALHRFQVSEPAWGGLRGSARDAARFLNMQLGHDGGGVLSAPGLREMQTLVPAGDDGPATALGWRAGSDASGSYLRHAGAAVGSSAELRIYPALDLGVAVFANGSGRWSPLDPTVVEVAELAAQTWSEP